MSMKPIVAAIYFLAVAGWGFAFLVSNQFRAAVAVEPIEVVTPIIKAERCSNPDCVCLDCDCKPCECKPKITPVVATKRVDKEWETVTTDELRLYYGQTVEAKRRFYGGKEWLYYNKQMYVRDARGGFVNYRGLATTNSFVSRSTAGGCSTGSCSSGGCSSGSCGVGFGRGRIFGRR